jgi:hypothetical protein
VSMPLTMALGLPLPVPPRTPSPPPEDEQTVGLGLDGGSMVQTELIYDPNALSPMGGPYTPRFGSMAGAMSASPLSSGSSMMSMDSFDVGGTQNRPPSSGNPFNFQTTTLSKSPIMKSVSAPGAYALYCIAD